MYVLQMHCNSIRRVDLESTNGKRSETKAVHQTQRDLKPRAEAHWMDLPVFNVVALDTHTSLRSQLQS